MPSGREPPVRDLQAILGALDPRLRWRWALLVPVMALAALFEAAGALAVFGLLRLVVEPARVRTTPALAELWSAWPADDPAAIVALLIALVAGFYVLRAAYLAWAEWLKESTIARSGARAADRLFARYLAADYLFHLRRRSASLIHEVARSTDVAYQLIAGSTLNILAECATIIALVTVLVIVAPGQALATVAFVLLLVAVPLIATRRAWHGLGERQTTLEEQQVHVLQQSLGGVKDVKISGREAFFEGRFRATRRALATVKAQRAWLGTAVRLAVETVLIVSLLAVVRLVTRGGASGADTVALMALFAYTAFRVVPSANRVMLHAGYVREGRAFVANALADLRALADIPLRPHGFEPPFTFDESLVCDDVTFAYEAGGPAAISHVHLRIAAGEAVGIVGPTGSGKSTLVALLLGLLRPSSGRILVDGRELAGHERAWQRQIGYVPQEPYVLDDTIRRNVAFGLPDALIDDSRVRRACALAQLDTFLRELPDGIDTRLGERGARLSGGQRQRIAIARALYTDPAVLVFDEATASLDNQTEQEVVRAVSSLHGTRTLIVVAHRLTTVRGCQRLVFLERGRVAASGTYDALLQNAAFRAMAGIAPPHPAPLP